MIIGACQFAVTGNMEHNYETIKQAIQKASKKGIKLLVFPECALTGYPPHDIKNSSLVDFDQLDSYCNELDLLAETFGMYIIVGAVTKNNDNCYNSAVIFSPERDPHCYNKRALWGWDKENFCPGDQLGVFGIDGFKIGVRICYEVRFPEYFRELYLQKTDLNIILFYDVSDNDDTERYELIKSHIRTRAVENVCHTLSVNATSPYQTAPTAIYDKSGRPLAELDRNSDDLLVYDLELAQLDFGEHGRKAISDTLTNSNALKPL